MSAFIYYSILFIFPVIGLTYCACQYAKMRKVVVNVPDDGEDGLADEKSETLELMEDISYCISKETYGFLKKKYQYVSVFAVFFTILTYFLLDVCSSVSFVLGCLTSTICGYMGMRLTINNNLKTINVVRNYDVNKGYHVAMRMGIIMGFSFVSVSVLMLSFLVLLYKTYVYSFPGETINLFRAIAGYGLGGSIVTLFSTVGGSIYTKAAATGAYILGISNYGIEENDIVNPACIATRVGDNVGNMEGTGSDLHGSLIEIICATLLLGAVYLNQEAHENSEYFLLLLYPLFLIGSSIVTSSFSYFMIHTLRKIRSAQDAVFSLKLLSFFSTLLQTFSTCIIGYFMFPNVIYLNTLGGVRRWRIVFIPVMGLWCSLFIKLATELYTSTYFWPVTNIAKTNKISAATGIMFGLSLGYQSILIPIFCLSSTLGLSYLCCEFYGVTLSAVGMLSTVCTGLSLNAFTSIVENSYGIAEILKLPGDVLEKIDALRIAGCSSKPLVKSHAVTCTAINSIALFGAFVYCANIYVVNILNPFVTIGVLIGAMVPYFVSSLAMISTVFASMRVVQECELQYPSILDHKKRPDYAKCVYISTVVSLKRTVLPGLVAIFAPILIGILLGKNATAGFIFGLIASGLPLSLSATNAGSAWENAKKVVECGFLGSKHSKGSATYNNVLTGFMSGNMFKDTAGQALNALIKLSTISALVFVNFISYRFASDSGGPVWLQ